MRKSKIEHTWNFMIDRYKFKAIILESIFTDKVRFFIENHYINCVKSNKKTRKLGVLFKVPGINFIFKRNKNEFEAIINM